MVPDRTDHGQKIRACLHQWRTIGRRDAANGNGWDLEDLVPPSQNFWRGLVSCFLGLRREKGAESHIISAKVPRFHRKMARGMAGNAQDTPFEQPPCLRMVAIALAEMRAITAKLYRKCRIVIQNKGNITSRRDGHEYFRGTSDVILSRALETQLQAGDIACIKRSSQGIAKTNGIKPLRRDEIEPAGSVRHDERQSFGEAPHKPEEHFLASQGDKCPRGARRGAQLGLSSAASGLVPFV